MDAFLVFAELPQNPREANTFEISGVMRSGGFNMKPAWLSGEHGEASLFQPGLLQIDLSFLNPDSSLV